MILTCPACKSVELKLTGTGTEKAEFDLQKLFPQAKIAIIDQENQNQDKIKDADIIIGTQYAFDFINWQEIQTIGVLNADTLLYLPDYRSSEKTFNLLKQLILSIPDQQKEFFAQTMAPENYIFSTIRSLDLKQFYRHEIKERKDLNYPPFSHLIKIIYQSVDFNGGEEEILEVYKVIKSKVESDGKIVLNPPALAYTQQVRGRFRWQIVIKVIGSELNLDFLNDLPENLIIDIDPESLN
jgi:primosomal protein N' (replication factor Y)